MMPEEVGWWIREEKAFKDNGFIDCSNAFKESVDSGYVCEELAGWSWLYENMCVNTVKGYIVRIS
jgi:hypothetical protein